MWPTLTALNRILIESGEACAKEPRASARGNRDEMTAKNENSGPPDPGLATLVALLRFHGVGADPGQIRHRFGAKAIGVEEMLRCAKELGIKARAATARWHRLGKTPLPAIAVLKEGG